MRMRRAVIFVVVALLVGAGVGAIALGGTRAQAQISVGDGDSSSASTSTTKPPKADANGVQHLHYRYGPLDITPGQNLIQNSTFRIPQPTEDGWIVGFKPNLELPNGKVPPVDVLHLHHGVWAVATRRDATAPLLPERFIAAGEEKTALELPDGYGYAYSPNDAWWLNYMIHNLTAKPFKVYITYDVDFVPTSSPKAATMKDVHPIWLDVQNGKIYPVFDVLKGCGTDGKYTYPDDDPSAPRVNTYTVPNDGVLVKTFGHLHPGGLYDTFSVSRDGQTKSIFTSKAKYYEPAGAVSWDVSMTTSPDDWDVAVKQGDTLSISSTYDTKRASWYESMGLGVVWMYDGPGGNDPFTKTIDQKGVLTHGHLPENDNHGGKADTTYLDALKAPAGPSTSNIGIGSFEYASGDLSAKGGKIPTVTEGQTITFDNFDAGQQNVWHSITACKEPCTGSTGVAYPLADADVQFDSGQLGTAGQPTAGRDTWSTPADLAPGTYTYFCRVHPFMRGAFRVVPPPSASTSSAPK
jgi:plastocyanin